MEKEMSNNFVSLFIIMVVCTGGAGLILGCFLGVGNPTSKLPDENVFMIVQSVDTDDETWVYLILATVVGEKKERKFYKIEKERVENLANLTKGNAVRNIYGSIKIEP